MAEDTVVVLREVELLCSELVKRCEQLTLSSASYRAQEWRQAAAAARRIRKRARQQGDARRRRAKLEARRRT